MTTLIDSYGLQQLPLADRRQLILELQSSVEFEAAEESDEAEWDAELDRRGDEHLTDPEGSISEEQFFQEIDAALKRCHAN